MQQLDPPCVKFMQNAMWWSYCEITMHLRRRGVSHRESILSTHCEYWCIPDPRLCLPRAPTPSNSRKIVGNPHALFFGLCNIDHTLDQYCAGSLCAGGSFVRRMMTRPNN